MRIFISSLISGMEPIRDAAREAATSLGHQPIMAEDFGAQAHSPQVACLDGLRQADVVILIMGDRYGAPQASGISATHEEYREARGRKTVLAFVQEGVDREPQQAAFVDEVQGWESGLFRAGFTDAEDLRPKITRALHEWQLANAAGPLDPNDLLRRAAALIPPEPRNTYRDGLAVVVAIAGGPTQPLLRPVEMENAGFADELLQTALFGQRRIFDHAKGSSTRVNGPTLVVQQQDGASISVDEEGSVSLRLPISTQSRNGSNLSAIIQEDVQRAVAAAFDYAGWLLERIDPTQRLTHVAPIVKISGGDYLSWRTRAEHDASPNMIQHSMTMGEGREAVHLTPPHRPRASLRLDAARLVEDLVVLLRRQWKA